MCNYLTAREGFENWGSRLSHYRNMLAKIKASPSLSSRDEGFVLGFILNHDLYA